MSLMSFHDIINPKTEGGKTIRSIVAIILSVAIIVLILFAISGTWPAFFAVKSGSMEPNIMTYSLVFIVEENRFGGLQTEKEAKDSKSDKIFNGYGDVIVYKPNGIEGKTPIIHRAIKRVNDEEADAEGYNGKHAGIITKGDNNKTEDQNANFSEYGKIEPVKDEWIVGKALFAIPLIGWIPLHIFWSLLIAIAIIIIIEIVSRIIVKNKKKNTSGRTERREPTHSLQKKK